MAVTDMEEGLELARLLRLELRQEPEPAVVRMMARLGWAEDLQGGRVTREDAAREYRRLLRRAGDRQGQVLLEPDPRMEALARIAAAEAARHPLVLAFRQDVLGGKLLEPQDVPNWIETRAREEEPTWCVTLRVPAPPPRPKPGRVLDGVNMEAVRKAASQAGPDSVTGWRPESLPYVAADGLPARVAISAEGVLAQLKRAAEELAWLFGWDIADAVTFVLSGKVCERPHIRARIVEPAWGPPVIRLEADPSTPARQVVEVYKELRRRASRGASRKIGERVAELAVFLAERRNSGLTWAELAAEWNRRHPKWRYANHNSFTASAQAAWRRVTGRAWSEERDQWLAGY